MNLVVILVNCAPSPAAVAAAIPAGGQRVEVLSERTETSQVFVNRDGTFTLEEHLRPQWVHRADGSWAAADPTLRRNADGTVTPVATTVAMAFSGGGAAPMATMAVNGRSMALTWPGVLPTPVLKENTATYAEILPGVDLRIVADVDRFTHIFVVKTRQAAASAAVRRLSIGTTLTGLRMQRAEDGSMAAVDTGGRPVLRGLSPLMWDSLDKELAQQGIAADPRQADVATQLEGDRLVLRPDTAMLDDPGAIFPLYVDPEWVPVTGAKSHWTVLRASNPSTSYFDRTSIADSDTNYGMMRAGFNDFEGPSYKDRSLWQMNVSAVAHKHIYSAKFVLTHQWSGAGCGDTTKRWTDLRHLNNTFSSSTVWNTSWNSGGSGWGATLSSSSAIKRYGYSCGPAKVEFPVTAQVAAEAAAGNGSMWVGLRARSETDKYSWKRYKNDAVLTIQYNTVPNAPVPVAGSATDGKPCATGGNRPWVTTGSPTLAAKQSDPDGSQQPSLTSTFYWWPVTGSRTEDNKVSYPAANGANATPSIPAGKITDGTAYKWQATTSDGFDTGQWSPVCEFTADLDPPERPAGVSAGFYNSTDASGGPGIADSLTFNPPAAGANEVTGYAYTIDGGSVPAAGVQVDSVDPNTFAGQATIAPTHDGSTTVKVWSKDRAGRYSPDPPATLTILVSSGGLAANYTFEGGSPGTDVTTHGNGLTFSATGTSIVDGRTSGAGALNKALSLTGGGYAETSTFPVKTVANNTPVNVRTDASFTVSAWVKITAAGSADQTAVAINGDHTAAFVLGYGAENKWVFRMAESDLDVPQLRTVVSNAAPTVNKWTHLTGTYDATTKTLRLYVGGVQQTATATLTTGFNAAKRLSIGSQLWNLAAHGKALTGTIDDVSFYNTVVGPVEIQRLAAPRKPVLSVLTPAPIVLGTPVQVKFDSLGDSNVTAYRYCLDCLLPNQTGTASGAAYTATFANPAVGSRTVRVRAQDANNLLSEAITTTFTVINATASVSGVVTDSAGNPIAGAAVSLSPAGLTTTSAANGSYTFGGFPAGTYTVSAVAGSRCAVAGSTEAVINGPTTVDLALTAEVNDAFGYTCADGTGSFLSGGNLLAISGDEGIVQVSLPFPVPFYGQTLTSVWVDVNGVVFASAQQRSRATDAAAMPNRNAPNNVIAPMWTDLQIDASSGVYTGSTGSAPNRKFVIEWRNVFPHGDPSQRFGFGAVLGENGSISFGYTGIDTPMEAGAEAVVGIENQWGSAGMTYAAEEAALTTGGTVTYGYPQNPQPLPSASITGVVTAAGAPVAGTVVSLDPLSLSTLTDATGGYHFDGLPDGDYHITAPQCAVSAGADITIAGGNVVQNLSLSQGADSFGYTCNVASGQWVSGVDDIGINGDDYVQQVTLPFDMPFYGNTYDSVWVDTNGLVYFQHTNSQPAAQPLPTADPTGFLAPLWDDLIIPASGGIRTTTIGTAPDRQFVIEWRDATFFDDPASTVSFEVLLSENGTVTFNYQGMLTDRARGSGATVGIESIDATSHFSYSYHEPKLLDGETVTFAYPSSVPVGSAIFSGSVTVGGNTIATPLTVLLNPGNRQTTTDALGRYQFAGLPPGTYTATAYHCGKSASSAATTVTTDVTVPNLAVAAATGSSGNYSCAESTGTFVPGDTLLALTGDDEGLAVSTPFPVTWLGSTNSTLWVSTNGAVYGSAPATFATDPALAFPNTAAPNGVLSPFWDDLVVDGQAGVYTKTIGTGPNRQFVIEWRNVLFFNSVDRISFEVVFSETGPITYRYVGALDTAEKQGGGAYIGMENATGTAGFSYGAMQPLLVGGRAITFTPVP